MTMRETITNALIGAGHPEDAAEVAVSAARQWLRWRAEEMRMEGRHGDAVWFLRIETEVAA